MCSYITSVINTCFEYLYKHLHQRLRKHLHEHLYDHGDPAPPASGALRVCRRRGSKSVLITCVFITEVIDGIFNEQLSIYIYTYLYMYLYSYLYIYSCTY